jgi:hypothetical protein
MPKTRRVDVLSAPNTLTSSSDAASATFGCSRNSGVVTSETPRRSRPRRPFATPLRLTAIRLPPQLKYFDFTRCSLPELRISGLNQPLNYSENHRCRYAE